MRRMCVKSTGDVAREQSMYKLVVVIALAALAGCGVETATTAATGAAIKKQEVEEGRKTMNQVEQKVGQAVDQMEQRAAKDADK
jgi:TolA-binding protein